MWSSDVLISDSWFPKPPKFRQFYVLTLHLDLLSGLHTETFFFFFKLRFGIGSHFYSLKGININIFNKF